MLNRLGGHVPQIATDAAGNAVPSHESSYNFSGGNGKVSARAFSVNPASASSLVYVGERLSMSYNTAQALSPGGWVSTREDVLNFPTAATVDKALVQLAQVTVPSNCTISALLGHESEIAAVAAGATVSSYAAYYVPNLSGVPNIGNVLQFYSFACDHVNSLHKNAGKYVNAGLVEYAPPYHPGIVPGRYYSAPHDTIAANSVSANVIYFIPVHLPQRALVTKIGFTVTTSGAGNARLGIYRAKGGVPEALMIDAGAISVSTAGDKEITIAQSLESGTYFLAVNFSVACSVNWHSGMQAWRQGMFGSSTSSLSGAAQECGGFYGYAFGAFPAVANVMSYNPQQAEPHIWFRA